MNKKIEDMIAESKLTELLHRNEADKQKNTVIWVLAIIGAVAAVAAIAYAVYRFFTPDYLEDFEDDFDDDFDDYFREFVYTEQVCIAFRCLEKTIPTVLILIFFRFRTASANAGGRLSSR